MTVTYGEQSLKRLLFRWKGSVWRSIWRELLVFICLYCSIASVYRMVMSPEQKRYFEHVAKYVEDWLREIPITFLLGFYVNYIVSRWWDQLMCISWPDEFLYFLNATFPGASQEHRLIRRNVARWVNLSIVLTWKEVTMKVKKRFPTDEHVVNTGLMTKAEFETYKNTTSDAGRYYLPILWACNLFSKMRDEGKISEYALYKLTGKIYGLKGNCGMMMMYDWINAPLRYNQVATLATYGYFMIALVGRQVLKSEMDIYVPAITILQFVFYVGWLKVAEEYRNPFGEDDEDFDMNYILDRNVAASFIIVDEMQGQIPDLVEDRFWNQPVARLNHTVASFFVRDRVPAYRLAKYTVREEVARPLPDFDHYNELPPGWTRTVRGKRLVNVLRRPKQNRETDETPLRGADA